MFVPDWDIVNEGCYLRRLGQKIGKRRHDICLSRENLWFGWQKSGCPRGIIDVSKEDVEGKQSQDALVSERKSTCGEMS